MPPRASSTARSPRSPHVPQSSSPNYFGLIVNPTNDPAESHEPSHSKKNWSPLSSSVRSPSHFSPKLLSPNHNQDFESFRKQSESNNFTLGHGNLSHFSVNTRRHDAGSRGGGSGDRSPSLSGARLTSDSVQGDEMDVDSAYHSANSAHRQSESEAPSYFGMERNESPAALPAEQIAQLQRNQLSHIDDRHPRLSLPMNRIDPPSPSKFLRDPAQRSATLPSSADSEGPAMVPPQHLVELLESSTAHFLILDLRVFPQFSHSRIKGALNLCIPTTLLKRSSFNLNKLADTFTNEKERRKFESWRDCQYLFVYDERSSALKDAASCVNTLKKFTNEGWQGKACVLRGGFAEMSKKYPLLIDKRSSKEIMSASSRRNLSIEPPASGLAPLVGGCPMPTSKTAANPFFGNIRQNTDLIGGVGQMPIQRPSSMTDKAENELPRWMARAVTESDKGKAVSDRFLHIEQAEQRRMQDALSGGVSYGSPTSNAPKTIQIAGIEKGNKNRYNNIWPYDHARVKLQGASDGSCDYINASHVTADWSYKNYIATQGPIPATFDDFWRVVWEQDVRVIVMLTAEKEGGQLKCHPYWTGKAFGPLKLKPLSERKVSLESSHNIRPGLGKRRSTNPTSGSRSPAARSPANPDQPHAVIRKFALCHTSLPFAPIREITQLQYSSWPDFGAPAHPVHVLSLVEQCDAAVRASATPLSSFRSTDPDPPSPRPVLVHCSAGCGRTGTFCTVDSVIDMLKRQRSARLDSSGAVVVDPMQLDISAPPGQPGSPPPPHDDKDWLLRDDHDLVAKVVEDFRDQRLSMVQSLRQFVLCYETVLEWLVAQQHADLRLGKESARRSFPGGL
ncbi:MAG: hypothetical protein M1833_000830 [Piccolia ochrophora]|nr:MAG: hypothetical protein M1833_000830 [Piccolia ochrophora]